MEQNQNQCLLEYIGEVRNKINLAEEMPIMGVKSKIILKKEYTTGLLGLDGYSHIIVIGLLNQLHESKQEGLLIRSKNKDVFPDQGIFALRGRRINSISFNACKLIDISHGIITVDNLDLITNTPILDLKPYIPYYDSVETAEIPNWAK
jgi:tRNA (adenine37-N6)-methyltransferase|tara:strand:- start:918 stop:1364 length:447 start_codon:yes stop_codon:yes gene_type:complete